MRFWLAIGLAALALPAHGTEPVVAYTITDAAAIEASLTGGPGDPGRGEELFTAEAPAGCAACHGRPGDGGTHSAPDLAGAGSRMAPGAIRLWIVAPEVLKPGTAMPAFYAAGQRGGDVDPLHGGPALTASQVEDLVAYLAALE